MKAFLLLVCAIFISLTTLSQDIEFISLEYSTAVNPEYAYLKVSIDRTTGNTYNLKVESVSLIQKIDPVTLRVKAPGKSIDKEVTITESQFKAIANALQMIKQKDVMSSPNPIVLDGVSCSISFGTPTAAVIYYANSPGLDTDKRKLGDFLNAYKLILRVADLNPEKIL